MGCCGTTIKYLLFIFNFIFVLCGIALIAIGAVLLADVGGFSEIADQIDSGLKAPQITLIVIGTFIFFIAFLGCCGSIKENKCMLITFGVSLIVIFIIQLAIGIYAVVSFSDEAITRVLDGIFRTHTQDTIAMFESLQNSLECCGVHGQADYGLNGWPVPDTCCVDVYCKEHVYWPIGCADALRDWTISAGKVLGGVAIGLSIVEIIGVIFAFQQARRTDRLR